MADSLSLVKFNVINFHSVLLNSRPFHPVTTIFLKLVYAIVRSEKEPNKVNIARLDWIHKNTHTSINLPISIIEFCVFKNIQQGLNRQIEIGKKDFSMIELYQCLDEISLELTLMVIDIAKKYSIEIPFNALSGGGGQKFALET